MLIIPLHNPAPMKTEIVPGRQQVYRTKKSPHFPMKTDTLPAATGTQNGNFMDISILNWPLQELLMGADPLITPHYDRCRRPRGGAPAAASIPVFPETELAPPCRTMAMRRGALPLSGIYTIFMVWVRTGSVMPGSPQHFFL